MSFQDVKAGCSGMYKGAGLATGLVGAARGVLGRYWRTEGPTFANRMWKTVKAAPGEAYRGYAAGNDAVSRAAGSHIVRPAVVMGARWVRGLRFTPAWFKRYAGDMVRGRNNMVNTVNNLASSSPGFNATTQLAMNSVPGLDAAYHLLFSNGARGPVLPRAFQSGQKSWFLNT